jgi:hypothetical protein
MDTHLTSSTEPPDSGGKSQAIVPERFSSPWYSRDAVIYFLAAGNPPKAIKIGMTGRKDLGRRMLTIQGSNHERISLLKAIEFVGGDKPAKRAENEERKLHIKFASLQRSKRGLVGSEWFNWQEPLISFVNGLPPLPDDLASLVQSSVAGLLSDKSPVRNESLSCQWFALLLSPSPLPRLAAESPFQHPIHGTAIVALREDDVAAPPLEFNVAQLFVSRGCHRLRTLFFKQDDEPFLHDNSHRPGLGVVARGDGVQTTLTLLSS